MNDLKIPVLLYHQLFEKELNNHKYAIGKNEFERQIKYLSENGFGSFLINDLCKRFGSISTDKKPIAITFDDGNYSDYSIAVPILFKYGHVATFFVTVNWIGNKYFLKWSHLKEIIEIGMSVQSHSLTHSFLNDFKSIDIYKEIKGSKTFIEKKLNSKVEFFSLPGGFFKKKVLNVLKDANYIGLCTSEPGLNMLNFVEKDFFIFKRFLISRKTSFRNFKDIVHGKANIIGLCKTKHIVKKTAQKLLGNKIYYLLWSHLLKDI